MELLHLSHGTLLHYHCPFNTSHTMPHKTLIKHLVRCPDRPPNFKNCIYNISHVMPAAELEAHENNCPNRILFDTTVFEPEDMVRPVTVVKNVPSLQYEESWDGMEQSADVLKHIKKTPVLMKAKHGSTKSERKKHRTFLHEHDMSNFIEELEIKKEKHQQKSNTEKHKSKTETETETKKALFIGTRPNALEN